MKRVAHRKALLPLFAELAKQVLSNSGQWHKLVVSLRNVCAAVQQLCVSQELIESASRPLLELFREAHIETATKSEVFDVLDSDMSGALTVQELTSGLMRLRGPITKTDVVATRLQVRLCPSK